jgi:hypothetical protein
VGLISFLKSKSFLKQIGLAVVILIALTFVLLKWLNFRTNHGEEIQVPDLTKLTVVQAKQMLEDLDLDYQINDTLNYNKEFPPNSIVEQDPTPNSKVKSGRKIYLKLNAATYEMVEIPAVVDLTYRQPYFAEDVVLEMQHKGKVLKPGDKVQKTSKIDFILGDGKTVFQEDGNYPELPHSQE